MVAQRSRPQRARSLCARRGQDSTDFRQDTPHDLRRSAFLVDFGVALLPQLADPTKRLGDQSVTDRAQPLAAQETVEHSAAAGCFVAFDQAAGECFHRTVGRLCAIAGARRQTEYCGIGHMNALSADAADQIRRRNPAMSPSGLLCRHQTSIAPAFDGRLAGTDRFCRFSR